MRAYPFLTGHGAGGVRLPALLAAIVLSATLGPSDSLAQVAQPEAREERRPDFSLQRIHGSADFEGRSYTATWLDAEHLARIEEDDEGRTELWRVEAVTGDRERWIPARELVPSGADEPLGVADFALSPDGDRLLLYTEVEQIWRYSSRGTYWIFDLRSRELRPLSRAEGPQMLAKFSPDGRKVAFVRDADLYVVDLESGAERRLTEREGEDILHGTTDWVYEEELVLWDGYRWSPDGRRIAYWRFDQSPIPEFYLIDETRLYPEIRPVRYPKAGTDNSRVRVGVLSLGEEGVTGETVWADVECWNDCYIPRMDWAPGGEELVVQVLDRSQTRLEVRLADPGTGRSRTILEEADEAWVDVTDHPTWIDEGRRFLWVSDRDGWEHVYLHRHDGRLDRQLTRGTWDVVDVHGVDEERGILYVTAAYQSPMTRSLLAVPLEGGEPRVVLGGRGYHEATFSPRFEHFLHVHSTVEAPPTVALRGADGSEVRVLEDNHDLRARLDSLAVGTPEFLELEAADGTPLNAWILRPADFDPTRSYGLLLYVYGGPGSQTVLDRWGGTRQLWHAWLAERGILVASVDNRGTGGRGRDFKKQTVLRLGELETADHLAALEQLGQLPYVDPDRLGIWGWSYGGYQTLLVTLLGGDRVAAGVSVAPVTHWRLYDTIYTERFMRTPEENPEGYEATAPLRHAARLESPLLLVHGTGDDNVHFQNTLLMVQALTQADRQFQLRVYPNLNHALPGTSTRVNLFGLISGFLLDELGPSAARGSASEDGAEASVPTVGSESGD